MAVIFWIVVFAVSLYVLVKGADWFLDSSERIGLKLGLSPFIVGVLIVGIGTSLPELVSSLTAVFKGVTEVVVANAVGSNIANILLVVGTTAVVAGRLVVNKDLIDLELPILAVSTMLFLGVVYDGHITFAESIFLVLAYLIYMMYTLIGEEGRDSILSKIEVKPEVRKKDYLLIVVGPIFLVIGAQYLIESVIMLSQLLDIATGVISITAIAIGTSLPELLVSLRAAKLGKSDVAIGNIFGSNAFNALMVVGIPGMFTDLVLDDKTLYIGVPVVALVTLIFIITGISKRIYKWEGMLFLLFYLFFILKLFSLI